MLISDDGKCKIIPPTRSYIYILFSRHFYPNASLQQAIDIQCFQLDLSNITVTLQRL